MFSLSKHRKWDKDNATVYQLATYTRSTLCYVQTDTHVYEGYFDLAR